MLIIFMDLLVLCPHILLEIFSFLLKIFLGQAECKMRTRKQLHMKQTTIELFSIITFLCLWDSNLGFNIAKNNLFKTIKS